MGRRSYIGKTRQVSRRNHGDALISTINTTPLVDVMLVLLIMLILSIPLATHKVPVDLPVARPSGGTPPPVDRLDIGPSGNLSWNDKAIAMADLGALVSSHLADPAGRVLHMHTDNEAPYERFDLTLGVLKAAGVNRLGFVDNGYRPDF